MSAEKKRILLKLTGKIFAQSGSGFSSTDAANEIVEQIKKLSEKYWFGIVIGGGNIFRGDEHGKRIGLNPNVAHQVGMLATALNALIFGNLCHDVGMETSLLTEVGSPTIGQPITNHTINKAIENNKHAIFAGGTGNPFFTTDTNSVLRALQIGSTEVWKASNVDGIYDCDPNKDGNAKQIKTITFKDAIDKRLKFMDLTALCMAEEHNLKVKVFDLFQENSLLKAVEDSNFGSLVTQT